MEKIARPKSSLAEAYSYDVDSCHSLFVKERGENRIRESTVKQIQDQKARKVHKRKKSKLSKSSKRVLDEKNL